MTAPHSTKKYLTMVFLLVGIKFLKINRISSRAIEIQLAPAHGYFMLYNQISTGQREKMYTLIFMHG